MPSISMSNKKRALVIIALAVLSIILFGCNKGGTGKTASGNDFTLRNVDGSTFDSSQLRGKIVLLEFWATWCPPCKMAIPEIQKLEERIKGRNIVIVTVAIDESYDTVKSFVKENSIAYTVLYDDADVNKKYNIRSVPTSVILDRQGNVVNTHMGFSPGYADIMMEELQRLL